MAILYKDKQNARDAFNELIYNKCNMWQCYTGNILEVEQEFNTQVIHET